MIWSIDLDDYSGKYCGLDPFPLTNAMRRVLDGRNVLDRSRLKNNAVSQNISLSLSLTFVITVFIGFACS